MKRLVLMLAVCFLLSGFMLADTSRATLTSVKHPKVHKHKAHKATKHKTPKRSHNRV
ncbi:MAG: hypothetical protein ACJ72H_12890 [Candidatus Sulfotelmatobacter sp.]|jgi:hypothetical protein